MNFSNILNAIAQSDPEVFDRTSSRRPVIRNWMKGAALAALPVALGGLFTKAYGKRTDAISDVLNFALGLEYLEANFYTNAVMASIGSPAANNPLVPPGLEQQAIVEIRGHEMKHVSFLKQTLIAMGVAPAPEPTFDFTANNMFPNVFSDYSVFLAIAQLIEDTGLRAYKGALPSLMGNDIITSVLQIHSVEARHSAHIRTMRRDSPSAMNSGDIKPWIVGADSNVSGGVGAGTYTGEDNTQQNGIQISDINGLQINVDAATSAFDEPMEATAVAAVLSPFIVI
ncbi:MAG: ferritin-like domain-containing protein [Bacteroidetes bacterium]|nr:ferritin-like domain-containing protein [Bacteroidota bacterium]